MWANRNTNSSILVAISQIQTAICRGPDGEPQISADELAIKTAISSAKSAAYVILSSVACQQLGFNHSNLSIYHSVHIPVTAVCKGNVFRCVRECFAFCGILQHSHQHKQRGRRFITAPQIIKTS